MNREQALAYLKSLDFSQVDIDYAINEYDTTWGGEKENSMTYSGSTKWDLEIVAKAHAAGRYAEVRLQRAK